MRFIYNFTLFKLCLTQHIKKKKKECESDQKRGNFFNLLGKDFVFLVGTARTSLLIRNRRQGVLFFGSSDIIIEEKKYTNVCYNGRILCKLNCVNCF